MRFVSRIKALGPNWVQFERPLPYDVRLKWKVRQVAAFNRQCHEQAEAGAALQFCLLHHTRANCVTTFVQHD